MPRNVPPASTREADYDAIESAVMETARGRWFLAEYARRNKSADTAAILEALTKLEAIAASAKGMPSVGGSTPLAKAVADARAVPWQGAVERESRPLHERPAQAARSASAAVRSTADKIREVAYELREQAKQEMYASALELYCSDLANAASLQDLATGRLADLAAILTLIDGPARSNAAGTAAPAMPKPAATPAPAALPTKPTDAPTTAASPRMADPGPPLPQKSEAPQSIAGTDAPTAKVGAQVLMFVNPN